MIPKSDTEKVPCLFLPFRHSRFIMIYFHANAEDLGSCRGFCASLRELFQVHILAVEYPGYGVCGGRADEAGIHAHADAALRFATQTLRWPLDGIKLFGRSLGTGPCLAMAARYAVAGVILISPFTSIRDLFKAQVGPLADMVADRFANLELAKQVKSPTLIVHGQKDTLVPAQQGRAIYDSIAVRKMMVCPAHMGHNTSLLKNAGTLVLPMTHFFSLPDYAFEEIQVPAWVYARPFLSHVADNKKERGCLDELMEEEICGDSHSHKVGAIWGSASARQPFPRAPAGGWGCIRPSSMAESTDCNLVEWEVTNSAFPSGSDGAASSVASTPSATQETANAIAPRSPHVPVAPAVVAETTHQFPVHSDTLQTKETHIVGSAAAPFWVKADALPPTSQVAEMLSKRSRRQQNHWHKEQKYPEGMEHGNAEQQVIPPAESFPPQADDAMVPEEDLEAPVPPQSSPHALGTLLGRLLVSPPPAARAAEVDAAAVLAPSPTTSPGCTTEASRQANGAPKPSSTQSAMQVSSRVRRYRL